MFDGLTERLGSVFDRLSGRGVLGEKDIDEALREVRVALLEADVALPVVKDFISKAREDALGEAVIRSIRPADQVVKIVYDGLVEMLGGEEPVVAALPTQLLTAESAATAAVDADGNYIAVADFEAQFKALWGVK